MSARRTLLAVLAPVLLVVVGWVGAGTAGATDDPAVLGGRPVPAAAGFLPAQLPEPAQQSDAPAAAMYVTGVALLLGGAAISARAFGVGRGGAPRSAPTSTLQLLAS